MGVRASLSALLTASALSGSVRVSSSLLLLAESLAGPIRVSGQYLLVAQSAHRGVWMNPVESDSETFGATSFTVTLSAAPTPEHNPYKPIVPEVMREKLGVDGYVYIEENQETLREQHNLTQAGDTTFPYQLTIASHPIQQYKLGAVGRFYHEAYGIIQARYVQFSAMVAVANPHCPVGLFRAKDALEWVVTNDYDKSHPDLVVGISAPWTLPTNSHFGWVIVDGPNLQQVGNHSLDFVVGEPFAWESTGFLNNTAAGKIVARRVNNSDITRLTPGSLWIRTESFSEAQINAIITASTQTLLDELHSLERQLALLPSAQVLRTLQATVTSLRTTLANETSGRIASDLRLNERISNLNFVTVTQLNNALLAQAADLNSQITNLTNNVAFLTARLGETSARLDVIDGVEARLQTQLDSILNLIGILSAVKRNKFPDVDGAVPPNLVYLDDGSLVYVEE